MVLYVIYNLCQILAFLPRNLNFSTSLLASSLQGPRHLAICWLLLSHDTLHMHLAASDWHTWSLIRLMCTHTEVTCPQFGCEYGARNNLSQEHRGPPRCFFTAHTAKRWRLTLFHIGIWLIHYQTWKKPIRWRKPIPMCVFRISRRWRLHPDFRLT